MVPRINGVEFAEHGEFGNRVHETNIEQLIIKFCCGQHAQPSAVRLRIAEGAE